MIVNYLPEVTAALDQVLEQGGFVYFFAGTPSGPETALVPGEILDALHDDIGLYEVESSFLDRLGLDRDQALEQQRQYYEELVARYPERAARADSDLQPDRTNTYILRFREDVDVELLAVQYAAAPAVEWAEPNRNEWKMLDLGCPPPAPTCALPNDPYLATCGSQGTPDLLDLWDLYATETAEAWCMSTGVSSQGTPVVIAVVDTGLDYRHPEFNGRLATNAAEDRDGGGTFEPWNFLVRKGVCEGGASYRTLCNSNPSCPTTTGETCDSSDTCTCRYGDFDGCDGIRSGGACPGDNGYVDDVLGYDFYPGGWGPDPDVIDGAGHGTAVAGKALAAGNDGGFEYIDSSGPFGGIRKILLRPEQGSELWKLVIHGNRMDTAPCDIDALFAAPGLDLSWTLEIDGRPWLRSVHLGYVVAGNSNNKLRHPD